MLTLVGKHDTISSFSIFSYVIIPFILGIVGLLILALISNIIYKALGGTGSYEGTVMFISYASAPMVLTWIPILGLIIGIYQLYLNIVGGMIVHKINMWKSAIAVFLPIVLIVLLAIAIAGLIFLFHFLQFLQDYLALHQF
jgi:hypothetical protein